MKSESNKSNRISKTAMGTGFILGAAFAARWVAKKVNPPRKVSLHEKVVLITGGGRGLGLILARKLARLGAMVIICGRSEETLKKAAEDLSSISERYMAIPCDITKREEVQELIRKIRQKTGSVDILINNAGITKTGPVEMMSKADFEETMDTHFWGPFYLMDEVLPDMKRKKQGHIVNIASIGSKVSFPHLLPYNTSKYALAGLSEGLTAELKKYNIHLTTVYPGFMRTGSPRNIDVKGQYRKEYSWFKVSDSLPFISMNAEKAADKIIEAMREKKRTIMLSLPVKIASAIHGIAPEFTIASFNMIDFLLPRRDGGYSSRKGYESKSKISESFLTRKTDKAAEKNLEK